MRHRMAVGSVAAALIVLVVAGCGGSAASPSPSAAATKTPAQTDEPVATEEAPSGEQPTEAPATSAAVKMTVLCAGVGVRKEPAPDSKLVVRLAKGTTVRAIETVTGDTYEAGSCGAGGDSWIRIDRINGKSIKTLYGVDYGYAAAGFFR